MPGLRTVIYRVPDLTAAKVWYGRAFDAEPYFDEPFYVGFDIGGYELGLLPGGGDQATADNVLAYWDAPDVEAAIERLLTLGATAHEPPRNVGGEIVVATVRDPWGNVVGLIRNPDFSAD